MSAGDLFFASFFAALGALLAWLITLVLLRPALLFLITQTRATFAHGASFAPLSPALAVDRYIADGLTPEHGMPTLRELQWLLSLTPLERFGWAGQVVDAFDRMLPAAKPEAYHQTLDDLGLMPQQPLRAEAKLYLDTVAQGFPIVGTWHWMRS